MKSNNKKIPIHMNETIFPRIPVQLKEKLTQHDNLFIIIIIIFFINIYRFCVSSVRIDNICSVDIIFYSFLFCSKNCVKSSSN